MAKSDTSVTGSCSCPSRDFAFAFNNSDFSDKLLHVEIVDPPDDGQLSDTSIPKNINGGEAANNMDCSAVVRIKTLHISSPILAATSPFFYKLFSNGMMETKQQRVTLRINASEEAALMKLLNFVYCNTLSTTTTPEMLDILMIADKFEVVSCMEYCSCLLQNIPMKLDDALLYLELPSSVLMAKVVQPLKDKAMQLLANRYKDVTKFQDEVLALSLTGIEAVLSSDNLQVPTEDVVYNIVMNWARSHYPKLRDRQGIIGTRLIHFIRFPYMTFSKLKDVLLCDDLNHELSSKAVLEALVFKSGALHQQQTFVAEVSASTTTSHRFVERAYIYRPIKIVEFDSPRQECVVYLDMKREEYANLFPTGSVRSQEFHLGGQSFFLSVQCRVNEQSSLPSMGLYLGVNEMSRVSCETLFKFSVRTKPTNDYVFKRECNYVFTRPDSFGCCNLFNIAWSNFIAKESLYFINDILHLRAEVTIKN